MTHNSPFDSVLLIADSVICFLARAMIYNITVVVVVAVVVVAVVVVVVILVVVAAAVVVVVASLVIFGCFGLLVNTCFTKARCHCCCGCCWLLLLLLLTVPIKPRVIKSSVVALLPTAQAIKNK